MHPETSHATLAGDRANNEDAAAVVVHGDTILLAVADGMGGHEHGEDASAAAIAALAAGLPSLPALGTDNERFLSDAFQAAHRAVFSLGDGMPISARPRTTCVAALVRGTEAWFAHVGDSRAYVLRDGRVLVRTRDHSHVEAMIAAGEISEATGEMHPLRNLVDRCLGGEPEPVDVELGGPHALQAGDIVLLCSDGFWEGVMIDEAAASLRDAASLGTELERLVERACAACSPHADNATAAVLRVPGTETE